MRRGPSDVAPEAHGVPEAGGANRPASQRHDQPSRLRVAARIAFAAAVLAFVLFGARHTGDWVMGHLTPHLTPSTEPALHRVIMIAAAAYVVLMALPFVPGVEIGMGMMMTFGPAIAPLVYGATVTALTLAFLIGRLVPQRLVVHGFEAVGMRRAAGSLRDLAPLETEARLHRVLAGNSPKLAAFLVRHRHVALAVALNVPGNALFGGGGGICMAAGFCRLFTLPAFLATVALAVAPVPLAIYLSG